MTDEAQPFPYDRPQRRRGDKLRAARRRGLPTSPLHIPTDQDQVSVHLGKREVVLTNLRKPFWSEPHISKGDLLRYYADLASVLLPHLRDRAMVMKRYPNGSRGPSFFMKRAPEPRPSWIEVCSIPHAAGNAIDFPVVQDLLSLLWIVNLGCIDLNPWYARCDDIDRPDYLLFDLDPVPGADFHRVCAAALAIHEQLDALKMPNFVKTTGARGIHIYVPIARGPTQQQVWGVARELAHSFAASQPRLLTAEHRIARRPAGRVFMDYNQNGWGRTLASVYSVRPRPRATVSMPVTWKEVGEGIRIEDFCLDNARDRLQSVGDLWAPLLARRGRFRLEKLL